MEDNYTASLADLVIYGGAPGDHFGWDVSFAGDYNSNSNNDIIVGAPDVSSSAGAAYIFDGNTLATEIAGDGLIDLNTDSAMIKLTGSESGGKFGCSVSNAGDFDDDGDDDDVVVGAYLNDSTSGALTNSGVAYVFYGVSSPPSTLSANSADIAFSGNTSNEYAGFSVSNASDINNDGYDDIIVGAPGGDIKGIDAGVAQVHMGGGTNKYAIIVGQNAGDKFGHSVSSAGDVNNDGIADIIIGAPGASSDKGNAYICYGRPYFERTIIFYDNFESGTLGSQWTSSPPGGWVVFNPGNDGSYSVQAQQTATLTFILNLSNYTASDVSLSFWWQTSGTSGSLALNLNDGSSHPNVRSIGSGVTWTYEEVDLDADYTMSSSFQIQFSMNSVLFDTGFVDQVEIRFNITGNVTLTGESGGDKFGHSVSELGDIDNDDIDDVAVGAPFNDNGGSNAGAVYVFSGSASLSDTITASTADYIKNGSRNNQYLGYSVGAARRIDNTAYYAVLAGAPNVDIYGNNKGTYYGLSLVPEYQMIFVPLTIMFIVIYFNRMFNLKYKKNKKSKSSKGI
jgi:hypothetical protein